MCRQFLLDRRHPDPGSFFYEGETLEAKVTEVDQTKFRFLLSLRMIDCYHGDVEVGLRLLGDYLAENQLVLDRLKTADGKHGQNIALKCLEMCNCSDT